MGGRVSSCSPTGPVLAFVVQPEGELDDADKGVLNEAGKLSGLLGGPWAAVGFPPQAPEDNEGLDDFGGPLKLPTSAPRFLQAAGAPTMDPAAFGAYGAAEVWELACDADLDDHPEAQAEALAQAVARRDARVLLLPHTDLGSALAPAVAARLEEGRGAALATELVSVARGGDGLLLGRRTLGPQAVEFRRWSGAMPLVATVDPRATSSVVLPSVRPTRPAMRSLPVSPSREAFRKRIVRRIPPDPQTVDVTEAEVIFCAGKGFDRESFEAFQELARLLKASLGVTRPVYDLGWAGFERMIGQTGKTVAPRFYLGMGISGSMHHVGGIKDSKRLVCLNIDPKAPMFPNSDEGFVADIKEVVPLLLERVRAQLAGSAAEGGAP
ncbi:MAG: hypothetical protein Kow0092_15270 [Deferrisomatales bacterium]